jgi:hypothetical protein
MGGRSSWKDVGRVSPDIEAALTAFAGLLEAEWYNGNLNSSAYERLNTDLGGIIEKYVRPRFVHPRLGVVELKKSWEPTPPAETIAARAKTLGEAVMADLDCGDVYGHRDSLIESLARHIGERA